MATGTAAVGERLPSKASGLLYGLGFGGFVDGIVLHQILQWHHMTSSVEGRDPGTLAGLEANTVADGFFHLGTWAAAVAGRSRRWSPGGRAGSRRAGASPRPGALAFLA